MYLLKKEELKELMEKNGDTYVTIYMPTHNTGKEVRQDPIRLKNLLKKAGEQMRENHVGESKIKKILQPGYSLIENVDFWNNGEEGLAIYLSEDYEKILKLPENFTEIVMVNSHFHLKQLLPFFTNDKRFFIIALSENQVRLIQCTKYNCQKIEIPDMPASMKDALFYIDDTSTPRDIPYKGTGRDKGNQDFLSGGKGGDEELNYRRTFQYFRELDKYLSGYLKEDVAPLIFAGTEESFPVFKDAISYPHLLDEFIKGNHDGTSNQSLHEKGLRIAENHFRKREKDAIDKYSNLYGTENVIHNIKNALETAYQGRVQTLLVAKDREKWGKFDAMTMAVEEHTRQEAGDHDLIDLAALFTIKNDGNVIVLDEEEMPKQMEVAGILRF